MPMGGVILTMSACTHASKTAASARANAVCPRRATASAMPPTVHSSETKARRRRAHDTADSHAGGV